MFVCLFVVVFVFVLGLWGLFFVSVLGFGGLFVVAFVLVVTVVVLDRWKVQGIQQALRSQAVKFFPAILLLHASYPFLLG